MKYYKYQTPEWHYVVVVDERKCFPVWTESLPEWRWSVYSWEHIYGLISRISSFDYKLQEIGSLETLIVCGSWHHMLEEENGSSQHH